MILLSQIKYIKMIKVTKKMDQKYKKIMIAQTKSQVMDWKYQLTQYKNNYIISWHWAQAKKIM